MHKHKGAVIAASLVLLALVGGVLGTSIGMIMAWKAQQHAEEAGERESQKADDLERRTNELTKSYAALALSEKNEKDAGQDREKALTAEQKALKEVKRQLSRFYFQRAYAEFDKAPPHVADGLNWLLRACEEIPKDTGPALPGDDAAARGRLLGKVPSDGVTPEDRPVNFPALAFSGDGKLVAVASGKTVRLWSLDPFKPHGQPLKHDFFVNAVAISQDGTLASAGERTVALWDVANAKSLRSSEATGPGTKIFAIALSPDCKSVLTVVAPTDLEQPTLRSSVQLWDAATAKPAPDPHFSSEKGILAAGFTPDGKALTVRDQPRADESLGLWLPRSWSVVPWDPASAGNRQNRMLPKAVSPDGKIVLTGTFRQVLTGTLGDSGGLDDYGIDDYGRVSRLQNHTQMWDSAGKPRGGPLVHEEEILVRGTKKIKAPVVKVAFSSDGKRLVTISPVAARLWDTENGKQIGDPIVRAEREMQALTTIESGTLGGSIP